MGDMGKRDRICEPAFVKINCLAMLELKVQIFAKKQ